MLVCLDADAVRRWCATGLDALRRHQHEIDELNIFPVPDGDTGSNLVLTFTSAATQLDASALDAADVAAALGAYARGALLGARGNSGVIVSELLSGLARASATRMPRATVTVATGVGPRDDATATAQLAAFSGRDLAIGLTVAADAAYRAVSNPIEGTILSVARAAAQTATATAAEIDPSAPDGLLTVVRAAAAGASNALARTPEQLPELARAGVVDAGGAGLVVLLDALVEVVAGEPVARRSFGPAPSDHGASTGRPSAGHIPDDSPYAFEVQFLLDSDEARVDALQATLEGLGDSLVIVHVGSADDGESRTWNVHVHVNDVGAAIEAAVEAGRPHRVSVTHFQTQAASRGIDVAAHESLRPDTPDGMPHAPRATVVIAVGEGLTELFEAEGAIVVPGPSPSTAEILAAIRRSGVQRVVVLPNVAATQTIAAAAAAEARAEGVRTAVVPTRSPVQALAALAVRNPSRRFEDDIIAMAEAAGACRYAEVTYAGREALTVAGRCQPGDVLGLIEGEVNLIGKDLVDTCCDLLDRLLAGGGELVTVITGAQAPEQLTAQLREHLTIRWPFVEAQFYDGGQPHHPLLVGVE